MTRKIYITLLLLTVSLMVSAQGMTYNHDEVVMNQFMKAEIGSGTLGAGGVWADLVYYGVFHKDYRNMANNPANNKMASRSLTYAEVNKEMKYAEDIKRSMIGYIDRENNLGINPFKFSISVGYVLTDPASDRTVNDYVDEADRLMYEIKNEYHKTHPID